MFFLVLLCIEASALSKQDSLMRLLSLTSQPAQRAGILNHLAQTYLPNSPEKTLKFNNEAFALIGKQKTAVTDSLYLELLFTKGLYYSRQQQNDTVINIQDYLYKTATEIGLQTIAAKAIVEKAIAHESLGDYKHALDGYFTALNIYEQLEDPKGVLFQCINLGLIYQYQKKYRRAAAFFMRAVTLSKQQHFEQGLITAYNNLGINFQEQQQYEKALFYFTQVLNYDLKSGDSINIGDSYNNLGVVYFGMKDYTKAEQYLKRSMVYKRNQEDYEGYANTCNNLAEVYVYLKPKDVTHWLEEARSIGKEHGLKSILSENYRVSVAYYKKIGNYQKAFAFQEQYQMLKDSMKLDELNVKLEEIQKQYEVEKAAREIAQLDKELERNVYRERVFLILLVFFFVLLGFMFYNNRKSQLLNNRLRIQQQQIEDKNAALLIQVEETNKAREVAEEAAKAKSQFLSTMSHEIRTPLNAIIGLANLLEENNPRPEQYENIKVLQTSSANLLAILNDVLDLSKIEAGKMQIEMIDFSVQHVLQDVYDLYVVGAKEKGLQLKLEHDTRIEGVVNGDPLHLNQILSNLVSNAIKFTDNGVVSLITSLEQVTPTTYTVCFKVKDTGIGIPANKIEQIFDSFTQADSNTTRRYGGTGLGLTICRRLLSLMNAKLQVKSELNKGSTFSFTLVLNKSLAQTKQEPKTMNDYKQQFEGKHVLVAEDNQINVFVIKQFLTKWGINITIAENGSEALRLAKEHNYDLILMDLHMPIMDGYEATREILKIKPGMKIIAITATAESEVNKSITDVGMQGFVMKPFQPEDLAVKINSALKT